MTLWKGHEPLAKWWMASLKALCGESGSFLVIRSAEIHREDIEQKCEAMSAPLRYFLNHSHMFSRYSGKESIQTRWGPRYASSGKTPAGLAFHWNLVRCVTAVVWILSLVCFGDWKPFKSKAMSYTATDHTLIWTKWALFFPTPK